MTNAKNISLLKFDQNHIHRG